MLSFNCTVHQKLRPFAYQDCIAVKGCNFHRMVVRVYDDTMVRQKENKCFSPEHHKQL